MARQKSQPALSTEKYYPMMSRLPNYLVLLVGILSGVWLGAVELLVRQEQLKEQLEIFAEQTAQLARPILLDNTLTASQKNEKLNEHLQNSLQAQTHAAKLELRTPTNKILTSAERPSNTILPKWASWLPKVSLPGKISYRIQSNPVQISNNPTLAWLNVTPERSLVSKNISRSVWHGALMSLVLFGLLFVLLTVRRRAYHRKLQYFTKITQSYNAGNFDESIPTDKEKNVAWRALASAINTLGVQQLEAARIDNEWQESAALRAKLRHAREQADLLQEHINSAPNTSPKSDNHAP